MKTWWSNKTVALLGGASFIGSHMAEALIEKEVVSLSVADDLSVGKKENIEPLGIKVEVLDLRDPINAEHATRGADIVFLLASNHGGRGFVDGHADGGVVIGSAHDQVDLGQHAAFVSDVVMGERATRRFHTTNPDSWCVCDNRSYVRVGDLRIRGQL